MSQSSILQPATVHPVKDKRLVNIALRQRWGITPAIREALLGKAVAVASNPEAPPKETLSAINTVLKMDALNLKEQELKIRASPKVVLHGHMTTEQLEAYAQSLLTEMGLSPEDASLLLEAQVAREVFQENEKSGEKDGHA